MRLVTLLVALAGPCCWAFEQPGFRELDEQRKDFKSVYSPSGALGNLQTSSPFSSTTEMPTLVGSDLYFLEHMEQHSAEF